MNTLSELSQLTYEMLFEFVEEMSPDYEMCVDFLESQDIKVNDEVDQVILELLYPDCDWLSNQIIPLLRLIFLGIHPLIIHFFSTMDYRDYALRLVEDGLDGKQMLIHCLQHMSQGDVMDMLSSNDYPAPSEDDEDVVDYSYSSIPSRYW